MNIERIPVTPSVLISVAVCFVHLAASAILWLMPIPVMVQAIFTVAIALSLIFFMARDAGLHAANSIVALELREDRSIACQLLSGAWFDCELLGSSFVSPQMTVINLRLRGRVLSRRVILVPDNVNARDFRRLRMWLRWRGGEAPAAVQ